MIYGQMSFTRISGEADYLQLDICGHSVTSAIERYQAYNCSLPVILHGDWEKGKCSSNSILKEERIKEYIAIIKELNNITSVFGLTLHPPTRSKTNLEAFTEIKNYIERISGADVFVENRSGKQFYLSKPEEISEYSRYNKMTIDIPQLFITSSYSEDELINNLELLEKDNIKEIHLANVKREDKHTYVGRKLADGILNIDKIIKGLPHAGFCTLEILGGVKVFAAEKELLKKFCKS
jgi:hypothetical protein